MTIVAWIICIASFLGGLSLQGEGGTPLLAAIATGLYAAALLSCPALWKIPPFDDMLDGRQRAMACLALLLALPLLLVPAA